MPLHIDTRGKSNLGIGICDRCRFKFALADLRQDPNSAGLMVCEECRDRLDRDRLPPRKPENINLPFVRPDETIE